MSETLPEGPVGTPPESSLRRELLAILVLYLALMVLPLLFGLFFMS